MGGVSKTSLSANGTVYARDLHLTGFVECKTLSGQRDREGRVSRPRTAYEKGFVREHIDRYISKWPAHLKRLDFLELQPSYRC